MLAQTVAKPKADITLRKMFFSQGGSLNVAKASDPKNQQLNLAEQQTDDIIIEETDLANVGQH